MYLFRFKLAGLVILSIIYLLGCQSTASKKHLESTFGYPESVSTSVNINHSVDFNSYRTFAIIESDSKKPSNQLAGLSGSAVKFIVSESLEMLGYVPVSGDKMPDMLVTVSGRVDSSQVRMSGGVGVMPIWKPGQTYTYSGTSHTNFNAYSNYGNSYYGSLTGTKYGRVSSPGTMGYIPYKKSDYTVQKNYAQLVVATFDAQTQKELVIGRTSGNTVSADPSLATQFLITMMYDFPKNEKGIEEAISKAKWQGFVGFFAASRSVNGTTLYPIVFNVVPGSPADKEGLKADDVLVAINGIETKNVPFVKLIRDIIVNPGDIIRIRVWRGENKFKELEIKAKTREEVYVE